MTVEQSMHLPHVTTDTRGEVSAADRCLHLCGQTGEVDRYGRNREARDRWARSRQASTVASVLILPAGNAGTHRLDRRRGLTNRSVYATPGPRRNGRIREVPFRTRAPIEPQPTPVLATQFVLANIIVIARRRGITGVAADTHTSHRCGLASGEVQLNKSGVGNIPQTMRLQHRAGVGGVKGAEEGGGAVRAARAASLCSCSSRSTSAASGFANSSVQTSTPAASGTEPPRNASTNSAVAALRAR